MAKKKRESVELRFYEIPQGEQVLALVGDNWDRIYGHEGNKLHFHNLMEIGICRRGEGYLCLDEEQCGYCTGSVSVVPENFPHSTVSRGAESNYWEFLFFDPKTVVAELYPDNVAYQHEIIDEINHRPLVVSDQEAPPLAGLVNAIMREACAQYSCYRQMIRNYLKNLVMEIMRKHTGLAKYGETAVKTNGAMQIAGALDYINRNYALPMKAKDLANVCSMSETHFRRVFEEYVNMSPMDYVNLVRVQKACELMKRSDDSMDGIAGKCGFSTTSTFNRNFKKFLDTSPYQWKINPSSYERKFLNYHITALKGW